MIRKICRIMSRIVIGIFAFLIVVSAAVSEGNQKTAESDKKTTEASQKTKDDLYSQIEIFSYALTTIQSEYVDEQSPKDLIYGSLKGMLASLDPHSQFLTPEDYNDLKTETQGRFGGLGIEISIRDGLLTVVTPLEDTPAWKAGIKAGDRIVKIGEDLTKDLSLSDAVKKLRGQPGTQVKITILREDEFKIHDFTITRELIHIQDVKDPQILEDHIGYVRLVEFREDSHKEFRKAVQKLKAEGADSLILDLRNNPGGLLNVAVKISEEFLPENKIIVSTKGRRASQNVETRSNNTGKEFLEWPLVVLINEGSASGSEIVAGALKDNQRAVIIGEKSFGKGSVQSVIPLPDGSGLRLTTSKYFTPSGISIHGVGIVPDIKVKRVYPSKEDEEAKQKKEVEKVFEGVEMRDTKDPQTVTQLKKETEAQKRLLEDNQVQTAISVIKGIKVFKTFSLPSKTANPTTAPPVKSGV